MEITTLYPYHKALKVGLAMSQPCRPQKLSPETNYKIDPIPLTRKPLIKSQDIQKGLLIRAYKHTNKVGAVGETTKDSLKYIRAAKSVKCIRNFEFYPYLRDDSCLTELEMAYDRLKNCYGISISIRRMEMKDIIKKRELAVHKLRRLKKIKLEFVYNGEVKIKKNPIFFLKSTSKCYTLKSLTVIMLNLPFVADADTRNFVNFRRNLLRLEEYNIIKYKNCAILNKCDAKEMGAIRDRLFAIKKFTFTVGLQPGWMSISDDNGGNLFYYLEYLRCARQVEEVNIKLLKFPSLLDHIVELMEVLAKLPNLKRLRLEFSKSNIGDLEMVELINQIPKLQKLQQFTIKVFQYPNVSPDVIKYLIATLSKHQSLESFNYYTRRLDMHPSQIDELMTELRVFEGVESTRFKQSLHVCKAKKQLQLTQ